MFAGTASLQIAIWESVVQVSCITIFAVIFQHPCTISKILLIAGCYIITFYMSYVKTSQNGYFNGLVGMNPVPLSLSHFASCLIYTVL